MFAQIRLQKRERQLLVIIIVTIFIGYFNFIHRRTSNKIESLRVQITEASDNLQKTKLEFDKLEAELIRHRKPKVTLAKLTSKIETSQELSALVKSLGTKEKNSDFQLKALKTSAPSNMGELNKSSFTLEIESSFISLGMFLEELNKSKLLLEVVSVELKRIDSDLKRCTATININGFYKAG